MPSKSKTKGCTFERDVAKDLNKWFDTNEFARTFGSGAFVGKTNWVKRAGMASEVKNALAGDIMVPAWFPFNIECKNYQDSPIYHNILTEKGDSILDGWLGKSIHDAINTKMLPMVIFKTTRKGVFVALYQSMKHYIHCNNYAYYNGFYIVSYDNFQKIIQNVIVDYKASIDSFNESYNTFLDECNNEQSRTNFYLNKFKD